MKTLSILFASLILLSAAALAQPAPKPGSPQALILGKWWSQAPEGRVTIQFTKAGAYNTIYKGETTPGKYIWLDDKTIELNSSQKVGIEVSATELYMTIGDEHSKFERVKSSASKKK